MSIGEVSGRIALSAAIGAGTASTEGSAFAVADFGWRARSSPTRGGVLRLGVLGFALGNDASFLSVVEPLRAVAGFQVLEEDMLLEAGVTAGLVGSGRYAPAGGAGDLLAPAGELGSFFTLHAGAMRTSTTFLVLPSWLTKDGVSLGVARTSLCGRITTITLCGDLLYANGTSQQRRGGGDRPHLLYSGLTVGLSP